MADVFPCPCYETKMAQGRDVARSHCWDNASNWSDTPCSEGIQGVLPAPIAGLMLVIGQRPPRGEGMNLLIGQLSFPRPLVGMVPGIR